MELLLVYLQVTGMFPKYIIFRGNRCCSITSSRITALFSIGDEGAYAVSQVWVSQAEDDGVDDRKDNDSQTNPGEIVKGSGLTWLHKCPEGKSDGKHAMQG